MKHCLHAPVAPAFSPKLEGRRARCVDNIKSGYLGFTQNCNIKFVRPYYIIGFWFEIFLAPRTAHACVYSDSSSPCLRIIIYATSVDLLSNKIKRTFYQIKGGFSTRVLNMLYTKWYFAFRLIRALTCWLW